MKKIIVLVFLISIPIGLKIAETSKKPLLERIEKEGYSLQPKDSLWEYVKNEFSHGRIDLKTNYKKKYKDPILLTAENATVKDSLAIEGLMKELKETFPLKEVAYFSDFIGLDYVPINETNAIEKFRGYYYDELISFTTHLSFDPRIKKSNSMSKDFNLKEIGINAKGSRRDKWNRYFLLSEIIFGFEDDITVDERKGFITREFFQFMWRTHTKDIEVERIDFRRDQNFRFGFKRNTKYLIETNGRIEDNQFLLEKIFSEDFQKQFDNYMYKTYPWRYASSFLNKKTAERKAMLIVVGLGLMVFVLMMSAFHNKKFKYSFLNYFLPVLFLLFQFCTLYYVYLYLTDLNSFIGWDTNIVFMLMRIPPIALLTSLLLWSFDKYIVKENMNFTFQLISKVIFTYIVFNIPFVWVLFAGQGVSNIFHPNVQHFYYSILFIWVGLAIGRGLLLYLNHFSESLVKQKDVELSRLKEVNAQSELKLLQSHINPHFLYNALNSIAGLAHTNADKTEKMALSLSDLFRYSINKKGEKMSTVEEEVTMVENYLDIEKIRFGDRLTFQLDIDVTILDKNIPMYILQPLVENAIKHGVSKIRGEAKIGLQIIKKEEHLLIVVSDNGPDFPKSLVSGHGLQTVNDLLRLSYGHKASLTWENTPEKKITIILPLNY